jgi:hypothetical protein
MEWIAMCGRLGSDIAGKLNCRLEKTDRHSRMPTHIAYGSRHGWAAN